MTRIGRFSVFCHGWPRGLPPEAFIATDYRQFVVMTIVAKKYCSDTIFV